MKINPLEEYSINNPLDQALETKQSEGVNCQSLRFNTAVHVAWIVAGMSSCPRSLLLVLLLS
jgi:hypothetical protein